MLANPSPKIGAQVVRRREACSISPRGPAEPNGNHAKATLTSLCRGSVEGERQLELGRLLFRQTQGHHSLQPAADPEAASSWRSRGRRLPAAGHAPGCDTLLTSCAQANAPASCWAALGLRLGCAWAALGLRLGGRTDPCSRQGGGRREWDARGQQASGVEARRGDAPGTRRVAGWTHRVAA